MAFLKQHHNMENFLEALVRDHRRYMPLVQILDNLVQKSEQLTWHELEQVGKLIADDMGSEFCSGIRQGMVKALGSRKSADRRGAAVDGFARRLAAAPASIEESDIEALRDAGLNDQSIEDLVAWVAVLKAYATMDLGLGFGGLPQPVFDEIGAGTVAAMGYVPSFRYFVAQAEGRSGRFA